MAAKKLEAKHSWSQEPKHVGSDYEQSWESVQILISNGMTGGRFRFAYSSTSGPSRKTKYNDTGNEVYYIRLETKPTPPAEWSRASDFTVAVGKMTETRIFLTADIANIAISLLSYR